MYIYKFLYIYMKIQIVNRKKKFKIEKTTQIYIFLFKK